MSDGKLSTQNIPKQGGGVMKTLEPGNQAVTIVSVEMKPFTFKPGAYEIHLNVVGKDMGPDFQGFFIDKNNESLGRYKGQVGRVKASEWAFADGVTKSGIKISRDTEILKWLNSLCEAIGKKSWMDAQDNKHADIESLVNAFIMDKPFENLELNMCIAGKEYMNKEFLKYDLFLPKFSKTGVPFELANVEKSKLAIFDEKVHIIRKKVENVANFSAEGESSISESSDGVIPSVKDDFVL